MSWRFWQRWRPEPSASPEAQAAQAVATDKLAQVQDLRPRVERIAKGLEELRTTNHLAERVWAAMRSAR